MGFSQKDLITVVFGGKSFILGMQLNNPRFRNIKK